jgi:hypothetical protein
MNPPDRLIKRGLYGEIVVNASIAAVYFFKLGRFKEVTKV